jgi:hypothetical protein
MAAIHEAAAGREPILGMRWALSEQQNTKSASESHAQTGASAQQEISDIESRTCPHSTAPIFITFERLRAVALSRYALTGFAKK